MKRSVTKMYKIASVNQRFCAKAVHMDEKLTEIEMTLAHQEQTIQELSDIVTSQWKEIETLKRRLDKTLAKIEQLEEGDTPANQKPPHY